MIQASFRRKILLSILFAIVFSLCTTAYTVKFYDGDTLTSTQTGNDGEKLVLNYAYENGNYLLGWYNEADGKIYMDHINPSGEVCLHARWEPLTKAVPGKNVFENGTFDGEEILVRPSNGAVSIVTEPDGNRALQYERGSGYASIQRFVGWDAGRTYRLSYRVKTSADTYSQYNPIYNVADHPKSNGKTGADKWHTFSTTFTIPADCTPNATRDFLSLYCNPMSGDDASGVVLYDDLSLIPAVMVTYHAGGGAGAPEATSTFDSSVALSDAVPSRRGFVFAGWALTEGGTVPVSSPIALDGGDVDLYAIWEPVSEQNILTYTYSSDYPGIADGNIQIIAPEEALDAATVTLRFADANGVLADYTPFAVMPVTDGAAAYTAGGSRMFAPDATRLCITFSGESMSDCTYWYTIPEEHRFDSRKQPLFTFYAISDVHLQDYWPEIGINRTRAVNDIYANTPDFVVVNGDLVNHGTTAQYERMADFFRTTFNEKNIPAFFTNGNHEFHINDKNSLDYDRAALLANFDSQIGFLRDLGYDIRRDEDNLWYSATVNGYKFIFLSTPTAPSAELLASYEITDAQLNFLDAELYDSEKSNMPAFIFSHVPLRGFVPLSSSCITNSDSVEDILERHPGAVFVSAHTHSNLSLDLPFVKVRNDDRSFTHLNDGCAVWLENGTSKYGNYEVEFSAGQVIEVYKDKILVKARKFADPCVWFGHGLYLIDIPHADAALPEVRIEGGEPIAGATFTAKITGGAVGEAYRYEWYVGGKPVGSSATYTVAETDDFAGKYLAVRVYDKDGNYAGAALDTPFPGVLLHFDANGGSGSVPADELHTDGMEISLIGKAEMPRREGMFFVGWSSNPHATVPEESVILNGETTVYAVYSYKPHFDFETSLCGWTPNSAVYKYAVKNGILSYSSNPGSDMYFTLSGIAIDADTNRYMRIKRRYDKGSPDGMFFSIRDGSGFSQATRVPLSDGTKVAEADGMEIYEYDLHTLGTVKDYWKGTVNGLRYDVIGGEGAGATDYITFSPNKGVYTAEVRVPSPVIGTDPSSLPVTLSSDTKNCTVGKYAFDYNSQTDAYILTLTLIPNDGYEFTTASDVLAGVTVNGGTPYTAQVTEDGCAVISKKLFTLIKADTDSDVPTLCVTFDKPVKNAALLLAFYDADGRLTGTVLRPRITLSEQKLYVAESGTAASVKAFVFESMGTLRPLGAAVSAIK